MYLFINLRKVELSMKRNEAVISVDAVRMVTNRIINIRTGAYYLIGTHYILIQGISKILPHRYSYRVFQKFCRYYFHRCSMESNLLYIFLEQPDCWSYKKLCHKILQLEIIASNWRKLVKIFSLRDSASKEWWTRQLS